jgi:membrane protease YdiL (CAAX protease family)
LALFVAITLAAAAGEEVGWRGYALPQLQRRFSPLSATLILAGLWWLWHLQFFVTESALGPGYLTYLVEVGSVAIVLTWLYNRSGGSILLVAIWHAIYNFVSVTPAVTVLLVALIVVQGLLLAILELRAQRRAGSVLTGHVSPVTTSAG